ncbi:MAG: ATP-binding protein [Pseudomonadota bacterium]
MGPTELSALLPVGVASAILCKETWVTAVSDVMIGACCAAVVGALTYLSRRLLPFRAASVPLSAFLLLTSLAHFSFALGILTRDSFVHRGLLVLTAISAATTVALLRTFVKRVNWIHQREEDGQRREAELASVVEQVSLAYSRAQEQAELKTQIFTNVSHELRTPLTLILGPIQQLREAPDTTKEQRDALGVIERNAALLLGHVTDLLELSRADAVGVMQDLRPTDLVLMLSTLSTSFRTLAQDLGISYQVHLPASAHTVLVDPEKLERIAMNLLANAFKFTPRGGQVVFRMELPRSGELRQADLLLSVDDNGPGIREEDRELVFERFQQLDAKPNRAFSGTGLGLAIVREFVSAARGTIRVERSELGGARFVVRMPVEEAEAASERVSDGFMRSSGSAEMLALRPAPTPVPRSGQPARLPLVLVVEDNPDMNRFVSSSLLCEFEVTAAFDGPQALAQLETLTPDLIVTDYMMPHMSGGEFVQALRAKQALCDVPVLVLTARDDMELRVRLLNDGVQDWLTKPFTVKELVARARNLVSARRARAILRSELMSREFDIGELAGQLAERKRQLENLLGSLTHALEQAELASRFKTSLLRLVSHELRTPLGALQLQLERLAREHCGPLNEVQQDVIVRMRRSLARLTDMIQSLLEYARIESGRLALTVESFDVRAMCRSVVDDFALQAEAKGLRLRLLSPEEPSFFDTDLRLLRLVLVNLVANALKFTGAGEITVSVECTSTRCLLEVSDTGPGIPATAQTSVFEPFFQGESAHYTQHSQGAGLGLSLVREMLQALGGSVELESELGVGTTFRVSVPSGAHVAALPELALPERNTA